jgi:hypothetical protein
MPALHRCCEFLDFQRGWADNEGGKKGTAMRSAYTWLLVALMAFSGSLTTTALAREGRGSGGSSGGPYGGASGGESRGGGPAGGSSIRYESGNRWDSPDRSAVRYEGRGEDPARSGRGREARVERPRGERGERIERVERVDRGERSERVERVDRDARDVRGERPDNDQRQRDGALDRIRRGEGVADRGERSASEPRVERVQQRDTREGRDGRDWREQAQSTDDSQSRWRTRDARDDGRNARGGEAQGQRDGRTRVIDFSQRNLEANGGAAGAASGGASGGATLAAPDMRSTLRESGTFQPTQTREERQAQVTARSQQRQRDFDDARQQRQSRQDQQIMAASAERQRRQQDAQVRPLERQTYSGAVAGRNVVQSESRTVRASGGYAGSWRHDDYRYDRPRYYAPYRPSYYHCAPWRPVYYRPVYPCYDGWRYGYRYWYYGGCGPYWYRPYYPYCGDSFFFSYSSGWYDDWCDGPSSSVSIGVHIGF